MKLSSLTLENFRCFQKAELDLSADVIAIHGRNGVGKTAIFDAIEIALLGDIGHYPRNGDIPDYVPCKFTEGDVCVRLAFANGAAQWIERRRERARAANWQVSGSGGWHNNSDFLFDGLLDPDLSPARRETEPAIEYVRATTLLSQHSIRNFVEALPSNRSAVLAYLAGVGAVQRRLDKAEKVLQEVGRRGRAGVSRLSDIKQMESAQASVLSEREGRIASMRDQLGGEQVTRSVLVSALQDAGIALDLGAIPENDSDSLCALVQGACAEEIAMHETRLRFLAEGEAMGEAHASRLQRHDSLQRNIATATARHQALVLEGNAAAQRFQEYERQIGELGARIAEEEVRLNVLKQLHDLQRKQEELGKLLTSAQREQQGIHNESVTFGDVIERLDSELEPIATDDTACQQLGHSYLPRLLNLSALSRIIPHYSELATTTVTQTVRTHVLDTTVASLVIQEATVEGQLQSVEQRLREMNERVAQTRASVEEAAALVSRLRQYATAHDCPLCGHRYPTVSALQEAIDARLSTIPDELQRMAADLQSLVDEKARLTSTLATSKQQLGQLRSAVQLARQEREHALNALADALEQSNRTVAETQSALRLVEEQAGSLQISDASQRGDLAAALRAGESQLTASTSKRSELITLREGVHNQWASHNSERLNVEQSLAQWQESVAQLAGEIQAYRTKCSQLGLEEDAPVGALTATRGRISEKLAALQSLARVAERYALSSRLSTTEGEQNHARTELANIRRTGEQLTEEMRALDRAEGEVKKWIALLSEHVNRAVGNRITEHKAEINSLFKAMIPTPYLFDEVTMSQVGDGLALGLRYRGQEEDVGEPQFYLSNAQANVLALSLFLSFTRAQRWARLETIMLDDPVQHLDDLDAVAFLDTLRSVALGGLGPKKQIVISTCDQNLYLLMVRKFGMLESMGLRFTGISLLDRGEVGPEILYDIGGVSGIRYLREAV